ncbi:hypothetical protein QUB30_29525, partial [Microcoleus sp. BROC3]
VVTSLINWANLPISFLAYFWLNESHTTKLIEMVEKYPDSTLSEYCEYWLDSYQQSVSPSMMCRELKKQNMTRKKRQYGVVNLLPTECKF